MCKGISVRWIYKINLQHNLAIIPTNISRKYYITAQNYCESEKQYYLVPSLQVYVFIWQVVSQLSSHLWHYPNRKEQLTVASHYGTANDKMSRIGAHLCYIFRSTCTMVLPFIQVYNVYHAVTSDNPIQLVWRMSRLRLNNDLSVVFEIVQLQIDMDVQLYI